MKYSLLCIVTIVMCSSPDRHSFIEKYEEDNNKLIAFFEKSICSESESLDECYETFFEKELQDMIEKGGYNFTFDKSGVDSLFSEISPEFWNEIWIKNGNNITFNKKGKYFKLLKKLSKNNPYVHKYINSCSMFKYFIITPIMQEIVGVNYDSFDMNNKAYRLFVAIHFISIKSGM